MGLHNRTGEKSYIVKIILANRMERKKYYFYQTEEEINTGLMERRKAKYLFEMFRKDIGNIKLPEKIYFKMGPKPKV